MIRNRLMSLASIITVASCTLIFAISYTIIVNINQVLDGIERSLSIVVFIDDEATDAHVEHLEMQLNEIAHVSNTTFISSEEAMATFAESLPDGLLEGLSDSNILPRSFSVDIDELANQQMVIAEINTLSSVYSIVQDQDAVDFFMSLSRGISVVGMVIILFLAAISTVIIINTIKITVAARENEINIMKYVGATDWFIRWPFLMEGILIGLFGAFFALISSYFIYMAVLNTTSTGVSAAIFEMALFEMASISRIFVVLVPVSILMGAIIGIIGSVSSIRRYLRV